MAKKAYGYTDGGIRKPLAIDVDGVMKIAAHEDCCCSVCPSDCSSCEDIYDPEPDGFTGDFSGSMNTAINISRDYFGGCSWSVDVVFPPWIRENLYCLSEDGVWEFHYRINWTSAWAWAKFRKPIADCPEGVYVIYDWDSSTGGLNGAAATCVIS